MADAGKLYQRIELALEEEEYAEAAALARRGLEQDEQDGMAWYYLLLAQNEAARPEALAAVSADWRGQEACRKALLYGGRTDLLRAQGQEWLWKRAGRLRVSERYREALDCYQELGDYGESALWADICQRELDREEAFSRLRELDALFEDEPAEAPKAAPAAEPAQQPKAAPAGKPAQTLGGEAARSGKAAPPDTPAQSIDPRLLESAAYFCEQYLSLPYGNDQTEEAKQLFDLCGSLAIRAKWGDRLEDPEALKALAATSSFWEVYGAEQKVGSLAGLLYDARTGAPEGLPWDDDTACYWAGAAASMGDENGMLRLGRYYECGVGVKPNFQLAAHFYNAAGWRTEQQYFAQLSRALPGLGAPEGAGGDEAVTSPPTFRMTDASGQTGAYWQLHQKAQKARLALDRSIAARAQQLLAPLQGAFDRVDEEVRRMARRDDPGNFWALLASLPLCLAWILFAFNIEKVLRSVERDLLFFLKLGSMLAIPVVCVVVYVILAGLFSWRRNRLMKGQARRWNRQLKAIRKACDTAARDCQKPDRPEYQALEHWNARIQETAGRLGVSRTGWQHAYLMYYAAGLHGAETIREADQDALSAAGRGREARLGYAAPPVMRWLTRRAAGQGESPDLLDLAVQYGRDCRKTYPTREGWKPALALECLLLYTSRALKAPLQNQNARWRTNPALLRELMDLYRKGSRRHGLPQNGPAAQLLADLAAEVYKTRYQEGELAALADLVGLYLQADDIFEAGRWAKLACEKRCPEFAPYAHRFVKYAGVSTFDILSRDELWKYVRELTSSLDFRSEERAGVLALRDKLNEMEARERENLSNARDRAERERIAAQAGASLSVTEELDRRERSLNILFGDGYMTNEELYLSGRQSVSEYVDNEMYRNFRRSEMEKKRSEQEG